MTQGVTRRLKTGIPGLDSITHGGIPEGRTTLLSGTAGSGKTVSVVEFLVKGVQEFEEPGVFVTFEEYPRDIIRNVASFGWDLNELIANGTLAFVDATLDPGDEVMAAGAYELSPLLARIEAAIKKIGARRAVVDSVGALFPQFADANMVRRELFRIHARLKELGVTTLMTSERTAEDEGIARFGVEEFVADNVILLRNRLDNEKRRRTIEILKFRGAPHQNGEFPFTIDPQDGITIIPLSDIQLKQHSSDVRVSSGVEELDKMCGGGFFRDSILLVSGATGTGKTLMSTEFVRASIRNGERALIFGAEESREQLVRNAHHWGVDFEDAEKRGLLRIVCRYPEVMSLEDHLIQIKRDIEAFQPARIVVDSMSAFERVASLKSFREFVVSLTSHIKHLEVTGLFTNTTSMLTGGESITETHFSTITDAIVLLRYVELAGEIRRGVAVLKMRGTWHEKAIREYTIDETGMKIGGVFQGIQGILAGSPTRSVHQELDRLGRMFGAGGSEPN